MILYFIKSKTGEIKMSEQLTAPQAAALIGCSVSFIRKSKQQGRLAYTAIGNRYTFEKNDVLDLVKKVEPHNNDNIDLE